MGWCTQNDNTKEKEKTNKLVHSTLGFKKNKIKIQKIQNQKKLITKNNNTEEDEETIQESSNQFTPFRRAVCDWLFKKKVESKGFSYSVGTGQSNQAKGYAISQRAFGKSQQFLVRWQSGGFLGSVVPRGAADSLLHRGEVLCLAELSAHTRHIGTAQVNTETLWREHRKGDLNVTRSHTNSTHLFQTDNQCLHKQEATDSGRYRIWYLLNLHICSWLMVITTIHFAYHDYIWLLVWRLNIPHVDFWALGGQQYRLKQPLIKQI